MPPLSLSVRRKKWLVSSPSHRCFCYCFACDSGLSRPSLPRRSSSLRRNAFLWFSMSSSSALSLLSACLLCSSYMLAAESGRSPSSARALSLPPLSPSTIFLLSFSGNGIVGSPSRSRACSRVPHVLAHRVLELVLRVHEVPAPSTCCTTSSRFSSLHLATTDLSFCSCSSAIASADPAPSSPLEQPRQHLAVLQLLHLLRRSEHAPRTRTASRKGSNQTMRRRARRLYGRLNVTADGNVSSAAPAGVENLRARRVRADVQLTLRLRRRVDALAHLALARDAYGAAVHPGRRVAGRSQTASGSAETPRRRTPWRCSSRARGTAGRRTGAVAVRDVARTSRWRARAGSRASCRTRTRG